MQSDNAQAVATEDQCVAAEVTNQAHDAASFVPLVVAAKRHLRAGETRRVRRVVADAGYWSHDNVNHRGIEALIGARPVPSARHDQRGRAATCRLVERAEAGELDTLAAPTEFAVTRCRVNQLLRIRPSGNPDSLTTAMVAKLDTPRRKWLYTTRAATIEPVSAQIKHNRQIGTLSRRDFSAGDSEQKLITATHILLKHWWCRWLATAAR